MRCLVADDDAMSSAILVEMLPASFNVDTVETGDDAVTAFSASLQEGRPYSLICMDVEMPGCSGTEALAKIRELEKAAGIETKDFVKVIMITSHNDPKTIVEAYSNGGTSFIVKPVSMAVLVQTIKKFKLI